MSNLTDVFLMPFKVNTPKIIDKLWGFEEVVVNNKQKNYCGKILNIKAGGVMSLHFHLRKDEVFYVISGNVHLVIVQNGEEKTFLLQPGNSFHIQQGLPHKLVGIEDARIAEFSTYDAEWDSTRITKSTKYSNYDKDHAKK